MHKIAVVMLLAASIVGTGYVAWAAGQDAGYRSGYDDGYESGQKGAYWGGYTDGYAEACEEYSTGRDCQQAAEDAMAGNTMPDEYSSRVHLVA